VTGVVYRAGDCFLQDSDVGLGVARPASGSIACKARAASTNPNRVEQWTPLTPGSSYYEAGYSQVWAAIVSGAPFNNTCRCHEEIDNGAGLSWSFSLPGSGSATYSQLTVFSPTGNQLVLTKTADAALTTPGGDDGYTITVNNPNPGSATLTSVIDHLPAGFT